MHARGLTVSMLNEPNLACPLQTLVGKGWSGRGVGYARDCAYAAGAGGMGGDAPLYETTYSPPDAIFVCSQSKRPHQPPRLSPPALGESKSQSGQGASSHRSTSHVCRILFQAVHTRPPHRAARGRWVRRLGIIAIRRRRLRCAPHSPSHTTPTHSPCVDPQACVLLTKQRHTQ